MGTISLNMHMICLMKHSMVKYVCFNVTVSIELASPGLPFFNLLSVNETIFRVCVVQLGDSDTDWLTLHEEESNYRTYDTQWSWCCSYVPKVQCRFTLAYPSHVRCSLTGSQ